jgi:hypothetical protein
MGSLALGAGGVLVWLLLSGTRSATATQPAAPPEQSPQAIEQASEQAAQLATQQTMRTWLSNGGDAGNNAVIKDTGALDVAGVNSDVSAAKTACRSLQTDVQRYQAYQPSPDPEYRTDLEAALAQYARGASDCVASLTTNSDALSTQSSEELHSARHEFLLAADRLKTIEGN